MADIFVGCEFPTYRELQAAADCLSDATGSRLVKSTGTRSAGCHNSIVKAPYMRIDEASLRYSFLNLACPLAPDCQFGLRAKACPKRQALVIVQLCLAHSGHDSPALSAVGLRALGSMALREASLCGDLPAARRLLTSGYSADSACPATGLAPLHWAAIGCQPGAIQLLLKAGADPGQTDSAGLTPRDRARDQATIEALMVERQPCLSSSSGSSTPTVRRAETPTAATASIQASFAVESGSAGADVTAPAAHEQPDAEAADDAESLSTMACLTVPDSSLALPTTPQADTSQLTDGRPNSARRSSSNCGGEIRQQRLRQPHCSAGSGSRRRRCLTPFEIDPERHLRCPAAVAGHPTALLAAWRAEAPRLLAERVAAGASGAAGANKASLICCWQCAGALLTGLEAATGANLLVTNSVSIESYLSRHPGSAGATPLPLLSAALYVAAHSSLEHNHPVGRPADRLSRRVGYSRLGTQRLQPSRSSQPRSPPPEDVGVDFNLADGDSAVDDTEGVANIGVCFDLAAADDQRRRMKTAYPIVPFAPPEMRIVKFMAMGFRQDGRQDEATQQVLQQRPRPPRKPQQQQQPPPWPAASVRWSDRAAGFPVLKVYRGGAAQSGAAVPAVVTAVSGPMRCSSAAAGCLPETWCAQPVGNCPEAAG
uniref:ANK_REP_REGION domain-containing protein n=2 Tax=Macrostomum lignano TaxID=282301 RepID=A0A1I8HFD8_9PLAT